MLCLHGVIALCDCFQASKGMWVPEDDYAVQVAASFLLAGEHSLRQAACLGTMWRSPCRWAPRACDVQVLM